MAERVTVTRKGPPKEDEFAAQALEDQQEHGAGGSGDAMVSLGHGKQMPG